MPSAAKTTPGKLPIVVWVLAAAAFLMGTTEFVIAGPCFPTWPPISASASPTPA
ncbi:hypothetical protein ACFY4K_17650 [Streptomyces leeuwenhoekii]|uniref:hypothetical protein n=1 Tax=Streptomyces leeuwenhoekii TaxID=1437453 RepID=UPI0036893136